MAENEDPFSCSYIAAVVTIRGNGDGWQFFYDAHLPKSHFIGFSNRMAETRCGVLDVLEAVRPHLDLTFDNILAHIDTLYVLKTTTGALAKQGYLRLKVKQLIFYDHTINSLHALHIQIPTKTRSPPSAAANISLTYKFK